MKNYKYTFALFCFFSLMFFIETHAQLSKVHYIPPLTHSDQGNAIAEDQYIYLSTPGQNVFFTIKPVGAPEASYTSGFVSNNNPYVFSIGSGYGQLFVNGYTAAPLQNGYIIESNEPIYASVRMNGGGSSSQAGALVSKGANALGKAFRIGAFSNLNPQSSFLSFVSVMATEDNTQVIFDKNTSGLIFENGLTSADLPLTITLDQGESYVMALKATESIANRDGIIGMSVVSDKDIAVNCGSTNGSFAEGNGRDYGIDQIVGADKIGTEYIFIRGDGLNSFENVIIVANENNTEVFINNGTTAVANLSEGQYLTIEGDLFTDNNMYVRTSAPAYAYQGTGSGGDANQGMFIVPPLNCESRGNVDQIVEIERIGNRVFSITGLNIIIKDGANLEINDTSIAQINTIYPGATVLGPTNVDGKPDYLTYKVYGLTGNIKVASNDELYCSYFNIDGAATSGSFYSGFATAPEVSFDFDLSTLGSCINENNESNVVLNIGDTSVYDVVEWVIQDETDPNNYIVVASNTNSFTPNQAGIYAVRGTINCTGSTYYSNEIIISVCPDDIDEDGIIDNIDLDNDNDGISDRNESLVEYNKDTGDILNFNLVDVNASDRIPVIGRKEDSSGSTNNTLDMNTVGLLTSNIEASTEAIMTYSQSFDESMDVEILPNTTINHNWTEGESFILKIRPTEKNITVINYNNNLLIDSDFDGVYDSGITQFTGGEIRFQFNSTYTGTPNFSFHTKEVGEIILVHELKNNTADSQLDLQILYFKNQTDTDNDTLFDAYDLDSDMDGCSDVTEAGFEDIDNNGSPGLGQLTFDNGGVDANGMVIGIDYNAAIPADINNVYYFQQAGTPSSFTSVAEQKTACTQAELTFEVAAQDAGSLDYQWELFDNGNWVPITDGTTFEGAQTKQLKIKSMSAALDGSQYRIGIKKDSYQCVEYLEGYVANHSPLPPAPIFANPIATFCAASASTIAEINPTNQTAAYDLYWYASTSSTTPLDPTTPLVNGQSYYAAFSNANGCENGVRTEVTILISDPILSASETAICYGEESVLSVNNIPLTAEDFEIQNPTLTKIGSHNGSHYFVRETSMNWEDANTLGESFEGASMYIINDRTEEEAVYDMLRQKGWIGDDNIFFWFGLRQVKTAADFSEPAGGWYWVDGTPLTYENWFRGPFHNEPNEANNTGEDYAQFEFADNGMAWNDMSLNNARGDSWPLFEFTGTTGILWQYEDPDNLGDFIDLPGDASTIPVQPTQTTKYRASITTNGVVCTKEITIQVNPLPETKALTDLYLCDDDSDGDNRNGIVSLFDLESQSNLVLGDGLNPADYTVTYHSTLSDANDVNVPGLISPYTNIPDGDGKQTIYVRVQNNTTGCIATDQSFNLIVNDLPEINPVNDLESCDDNSVGSDTDGFIDHFNLEEQTSIILGGQDPNVFEVTYHKSAADANDLSKIGLSSPYTNTTVDEEEIFIRVLNKNTNCFRADASFFVRVNKLPELLTIETGLKQCDDLDADPGITQFNLMEAAPLLSDNYTNETFTFFTDVSFDLSSQINNPTTYSNQSLNETIHVIITNGKGCERKARVNLSVSVTQIPVDFMETYRVCEDSDSMNQDGIATFDFSDIEGKIQSINPLFNQQNVSFSFYETMNDALQETNAIADISQYRNEQPWSTTWTQNIFIRIESDDNNECLGLGHHITLEVERKPIAHPVQSVEVCSVTNPLMYNFDLSHINNELLQGQSTTDVTVAYYDASDNYIGTDFPQPFPSGTQTIKAIVSNNSTLACSDTTFFDLIVYRQPVVQNIPDYISCDISDGVADGRATFDTGNISDLILGGQNEMEFIITDELGNTYNNNFPALFDTVEQTVRVEIYNPAYNNCTVQFDISFKVIPLPEFDLNSPEFVCLLEEPKTIEVVNASGTYDYTWTYTDESGTTTTLINNSNSLSISEAGTYNITATESTNSLCSNTKSVTVSASNKAPVTSNNLFIVDLQLKNDNFINIIGGEDWLGTYQYAIDNPDGDYQDAPFFNQLEPGKHILYIQNLEGCDRAEIAFYVIDYPRFFSPNNDNINDNWTLLGIDENNESNALVFIYDRYGNLIEKLKPSVDFWDGTVNGKLLPPNDYWFMIQLENGVQFSGHFSLLSK